VARWPGTVFSAAADLGVMIYVFFLSQIILRDRLLDLYEFFGRMLVFGVLTLLFASISGVMIFAFPAEGNAETFNKLFNMLISIIIVLTLYDPIRERLDAKAIELFFRERRGFPQVLDQLRRTMLRVLDPGRMSKLVLDTLYDERRCTHAAIYLLEEPLGRSFRLEAYRGPAPTARINERQRPALWHAVQQNKAAILVEQLIRGPDDSKDSTAKQDLIEAMRAASADVLLPFLAGDRVLGFLALRDDRVAEAYSTEEIALLMNIADTAVIVLENSHLARRLTERDRLAAIGEMAAGLAHEVRNPLGAIKGAAQYLEPGTKSGDEAELLQVIVDESNRLNGVVSQFLDYARPFRAQFSNTDLNDVVKKTVKLVEAKQDADACPVVFNPDEDLKEIEVDAEQIKQVILNLILNGAEASGSSDSPVEVSTRYIPERERVEIRVRDRGPGIPRDALPHIFVPFFTTKQNGTGLGLAVCQRIITNHGGDIRVQSQRKEGTTFIIRLPLRRRIDSSGTGSYVSKTPAPRPTSLAPLTSDMPSRPPDEASSVES
jgi:two-component system, NtrC family, sensor histidine kinase HydH